MKKEFVPLNIASAMHGLGFNEDCLGHYDEGVLRIEVSLKDRIESINKTPIMEIRKKQLVLAPTYGQAFRWFREKYNLNHYFLVMKMFNTGKYTIEESEEWVLKELVRVQVESRKKNG